MRKLPGNALPAVIGAIVAAVAVTAIAFAAGGATISKSRLKVKCPTDALAGKRVTCRVVGRLPQGPQGAQGPRGQKGQKGDKGAKGDDGPRGFAGIAGVSGYEVVSQPFKEVFIVKSSDGMRGLSDIKAVACPKGKRVIGGGADLGANEAQAGQQRQVTVSLSAPNGTGTGWSVQLFNNAGFDLSIDLTVYAICATAS